MKSPRKERSKSSRAQSSRKTPSKAPTREPEVPAPTEEQIWQVLLAHRRELARDVRLSKEACRTLVGLLCEFRSISHQRLTPILEEKIEVVISRGGHREDFVFPPINVRRFDPEDELRALLGGRDPHQSVREAAFHTAWNSRLLVSGYEFGPHDENLLLEALNRFPEPNSVAARWLTPAVLTMLDPSMTVDEYFSLEENWFGQRHGLWIPEAGYLFEQWDRLEDWSLRCFVDYPLLRTDHWRQLRVVVMAGISRLSSSHDLRFDRMLHPIKRLLMKVLDGSVNYESPMRYTYQRGQRIKVAPDRLELQRQCREWFEALQLALIPNRPSVAAAEIDVEHVRRYDQLLVSVRDLWLHTRGQMASRLRREGLEEEFWFLDEKYWPAVGNFWRECGDLGESKAHEVAARLLCLLLDLKLSPQRVRSKIAKARRELRLP